MGGWKAFQSERKLATDWRLYWMRVASSTLPGGTKKKLMCLVWVTNFQVARKQQHKLGQESALIQSKGK